MPVQMVCDSTSLVSAALRDSLGSSSTNSSGIGSISGNSNNGQSSTSLFGASSSNSSGFLEPEEESIDRIENTLTAAIRRNQLRPIRYEEVPNYSSDLDSLKSKYTVLRTTASSTSSNSINESTGICGAGATNGNTTNTNGLLMNGGIHSTMTTKAATADTSSSGGGGISQQNGSSSGNAKDLLPTPKRILFPRDCVQHGWKASGRKWGTGAGMINVGNTCYLNSTLQALFHVPAIANWLASDSGHRERCDDRNDGCIICAMAKTLIASQGNQGAIKPYLVYSKLRVVCKHLVPGRQEDAHEFLRYLMEAMEKSFLSRFDKSKELDQYSKETTPLNQILGGYLRSEVKCLSCQHISTTFQHFEDLLLDIRKASSIEEALDVYFARERLEEMQYKCEACKKRVAATKQFSLERAPFVLCIQLKRFSMLGGKINKHVELRNRLDLTPYSSKSATSNGKLTYKLVSMVTHLGNTQHCGHYTAIGSTESGTYYVFDDSSVRPISIQNVTNTNAYIIFYELESVQNGIKTSASSTATLTSFANATGSSPRKIGSSGATGGTFTNSPSSLRLLGSSGNSSHNPLFPSKLENRPNFIGPVLPQQTQPKPKKLVNGLSNHHAMEEKDGETIVSSTTARLSPVSSTTSSLSSTSPLKNPTPNSPSSSKLSKNPLIQSPVSVKNKFGMTITTSNSSSGISNGISGTNISFKSSSVASQSSSAYPSSSSSTLPSMPKLCNSPAATKSSISGEKSFEGTNPACIGTLKGVAFSAATPTGGKNNFINGHSSSKAVSLVPYDADDDDDDDEGDDCYGGSSANRLVKRRTTQQDNDSEEDTKRSHSNARLGPTGSKKLPESPEEEESSRSPKSPPVIKTKTGLWQVSDNTVQTSSSSSSSANSSKSASPSTSGNSSPANYVHTNGTGPLASGYQTSNNNCSNGRQTNGFVNGYNNGYNRNNDVVNQLQKFSHRGYGAPVRSWNGQQANMERELINERREDRKRQVEDDRETEMDRGRIKKIKTQYYSRDQRDSGNQVQNPFQSYQNQQMNGGGNNRNKWNNHCNGFGGGGSKYGGGHHFQHRNYHNNHHHQNGRNYQPGGFRNGGRHGRNGFYNKSNHHHQRDSGSGNGFHNR